MDWNQLVPTSKTLLKRVRSLDDDQGWKLFTTIYSRLIYGAALKANLTEAEAQDVVQETLVAVAKALPKFEYRPRECSFKTWLHQITKRQIANQFRRRLCKGRLLEPLPGGQSQDSDINALTESSVEQFAEIWDQEWQDTLLTVATDRVRRSISPAQFLIYDYYVRQDHTATQTASALGFSLRAVYIAKSRISKLIRKEVLDLSKKLL